MAEQAADEGLVNFQYTAALLFNPTRIE